MAFQIGDSNKYILVLKKITTDHGEQGTVPWPPWKTEGKGKVLSHLLHQPLPVAADHASWQCTVQQTKTKTPTGPAKRRREDGKADPSVPATDQTLTYSLVLGLACSV